MTAGDELGELCRLLLDSMRENLEEGYEEMWKTIENQKKLNAAFAHDLRTPTDSTERIFRIFSQISAPGQSKYGQNGPSTGTDVGAA